MVVFPNGKINLGLSILRKRPDGYHDIESCFYPVGWTDALEVLPADKLSFSSHGIDIPGDPATNLCLKAYELIKQDFDIPPVKINLLKNIPIGAGLGGGSADASFMLKILSTQFGLHLSAKELEKYAAKLGSDCPFFIANKPIVAIDTGTTFESINCHLSDKYIVIVYPNIHISTSEAYAGIVTGKPDISVREIIENYPIENWKDLLKNDFESSLIPNYPTIQVLKEDLYSKGALYASMTGSGSAVYGIFQDEVSTLLDPDLKSWSGWLT